ncbi:hypothetical protein BJ741DRAFT_284364 [Chytriomyces cf. hyalinus JEL632]|nr:hypothetical protein BJ741DRAFT_284364 [Chytriomyces cf. hyalinus JEL632]
MQSTQFSSNCFTSRGFDENFNYIRTLDEHAFHDKWLGGISGDEIKRAKVASDRQKARISAMDALEEEDADENSCWKTVLSFMKPKETVAGALKRLGGPKKIPAWKKNQKKKPDALTAEKEETPEAAEHRKKSLADLITVTDSLTGQYGRYVDPDPHSHPTSIPSFSLHRNLHLDCLLRIRSLRLQM